MVVWRATEKAMWGGRIWSWATHLWRSQSGADDDHDGYDEDDGVHGVPDDHNDHDNQVLMNMMLAADEVMMMVTMIRLVIMVW